MIKILICSLGLALMVAACGKKDDDKGKGDKPGASAPSAPDPAAGPPSKAQVSAMDCNKACTGQFDCAKKNGMLSPDAKLSDCEQGCAMIKSIYDPAKHDMAARRMLDYEAGKCD
jgi:hypothetical protein